MNLQSLGLGLLQAAAVLALAPLLRGAIRKMKAAFQNRQGPPVLQGSGPFQWVEWVDGRYASVRRNPNWHGGDGRPNLDGVSLVQPATTADMEADLRTRDLDAALVGRVLADRLKKARPQLMETAMGHSQFFGMRFGIEHDPYNDLRFRSALTYAIVRRAMIQ